MRDEQRSIRWPGQNATVAADATSGSGMSRLTVAGLIGVIAALVATAVVVVGLGGGSASALAQAEPVEPLFAPRSEEGPDAFFPLDVQMAVVEAETGTQVSSAAVATGLFGGTAENTCDPQRLVDYLMQNPAKGRAWAAVQGIEFQEIASFVESLDVRVLASPIEVLNHGFDAATGNPYEIPTTLEAGTAVLVDANGDIRTRCYCGNPTKPMPVGHKPPRCVVVPALVFTSLGGSRPAAKVPMNVVLTGTMSVDGAWHEVSWGGASEQRGWTQTANLTKHLCIDPGVEIPPAPQPTPEPSPEPIPTEPPTPEPSPEPIPTEPPTPEPSPEPIPTEPPTPGPSPEPTPPAPQPTPPAPQPFQPYCSISDDTVEVGETTEFSAGHVPDSVRVTWSFDHGDGTVDRANPSKAFYRHAGTYTVTGLADLGGGDIRHVPCGTVTVAAPSNPPVFYCHISATRILEGGTTTFTGSTDPHDLPVTWVFDHGDGYRETANPSISLYPHAGSYDVTAEATLDGRTTVIDCGTVEVIQDTRPEPAPDCTAGQFLGLTLTQARNLADHNGCAHRVHGEIGTTDYRPERLNFVLGQFEGASVDTVIEVRYG